MLDDLSQLDYAGRRKFVTAVPRASLEVLALDALAELYPVTKRCPGCGLNKLRASFRANQRQPDGLQTWCKQCQAKHRSLRAVTPTT